MSCNLGFRLSVFNISHGKMYIMHLTIHFLYLTPSILLIFLNLSWFSGTEFVVVEDSSCLDTNAIILKGTTVLTYKPRLLDRPFSGSLAGIEVTSLLLH